MDPGLDEDRLLGLAVWASAIVGVEVSKLIRAIFVELMPEPAFAKIQPI
jgi:hypothetical protein